MFNSIWTLIKAEIPMIVALFVTTVLVPLGEQIGFPLSTVQQQKIEGWIDAGIVLLGVAITRMVHTKVQMKRTAELLPNPQPAAVDKAMGWTKGGGK
jgi:hypothetical protein